MSNWQRWGIIVGCIAFALLIYLLKPILAPFLIAALFAYLGDPLVNRLVRWRIPRTLAVICVFALLISIILGLVGTLAPLLQTQLLIFIDKLPAFIDWLQTSAIPWLHDHLDLNNTINVNTIKATLLANWQQTGSVADKILRTVSHSSIALITFLINIVLIPVVTFYLLRDWPVLVRKMKALVPRKLLPTLSEIFGECNEVLGAFFRGQLLVMLALGVFYSAGLAIIGLELALLIGVIIAVFSIVPYLGAIIGLLSAILATLFQFHDTLHIIYTVILFVLGHLLEGMVLTPLLIGDRIGLHPVAVIFAILAGGELFGFIGILLALPAAAVIKVLLHYTHKHYLNSPFYR